MTTEWVRVTEKQDFCVVRGTENERKLEGSCDGTGIRWGNKVEERIERLSEGGGGGGGQDGQMGRSDQEVVGGAGRGGGWEA